MYIYHNTMRTLHSPLSKEKPHFCNICPCARDITYNMFEDVRTVLYVFMSLSWSFGVLRITGKCTNRPFLSSLVPLFQNESKCETFHMKMSSACSFILMQIKVIFITTVSHLDSFWNRGTRELGNGLLPFFFPQRITSYICNNKCNGQRNKLTHIK